MKEIFDYHQRRYGYRRVAMQLRKEGYAVTDRAVRYWMHKLKLKGRRRNKRKYSSYKGTIGKIAPNLNSSEASFANDKYEVVYRHH